MHKRHDYADSNPGSPQLATFLFLLSLLLLLTVFLWLRGIDEASIWFDEGWSAHAASQPTLIDAFNADATNPPLYYGLLHITARLWGTSEFGLRVTSLFFGVIAVALAVRLAHNLGGRRAALLMALFGALSAPLAWAAQEARMYTLLAIGVLVCVLAWERLRTRPTRWAWVALWIAELALLYAHNTGPVIVLWLNAVTLLTWVVRRDGRPDWRVWFAGQVAVGLLWMPYFVTRFLLLSEANSAVGSMSFASYPLFSLWSAWVGIWFTPRNTFNSIYDVDLAASCAVIGIISLLFVWLWGAVRASTARWSIAHSLIIVVLLLIALSILGTDLHPRYLIMVVPLVLTAFAVGLVRMKTGLRLAGVGLVAVVFSLIQLTFTWAPARNDDVRGMVGYYTDTLSANDTVLAWSYADRYDLAYYWDRLGVTARRVTLPEGADYQAVAPMIPTSGRVALNVWYTQRADYRGMMGCVLEHGADAPPTQHTTAGMTTLIYDRAPVPLAPLQPRNAAFTDSAGSPIATVTEIGVIPAFAASRTLCVPITIRLERDNTTDLRAAVSVRHPIGGEIARADAIFASATQRTTSQLDQGDSASAFALVKLPVGAPAFTYDVTMRLYDAAVPSGYEPLRGGAITSGRDLHIGVWEAGLGAWDAGDSSGGVQIEELTLLPHPDATVRNGETIRVDILWRGQGESPPLSMRDVAGTWAIASDTLPAPIDGLRREWYSFTLPADAPDGEAVLTVEDTEIARWRVESAPFVSNAPPSAIVLDARFVGVGTLIGATPPDTDVRFDVPFPVELVWRAGAASDVSYTVFVQAIDAAGAVVAQSDSTPGEDRFTTGWRAREVIVDAHLLTWNRPPAPGDLTLIAGLYDPLTGGRVSLPDDADHGVIGVVKLD